MSSAPRAAWLFATGITGVLCLLYVVAALVLSETRLIDGSTADGSDIATALCVMAIYILAIGQFHLLDIAFRVAGRWGEFNWLGALGTAGDAIAVAIALWWFDSFTALAAAMAANRILLASATFGLARRLSNALFSPKGRDMRRGAAGLLRPSIGLMLLPLVSGLNVQGYALLVGFAFSPAILAAFVTTRVLVRLLDLFGSVTYAMQFYELGYLEDEREAVERRMLATMTMLILIAILGFSVLVLTLGPWLQEVLSDGHTRFAPELASVLLLAGGLRILSTTPLALLAARNRVTRASSVYCLASIAGLLLAGVSATAGAPMTTVMLGLVLAEAVYAFTVFRGAFAETGLTPGRFLRACVARERVEDCLAMTGRLLRRQ